MTALARRRGARAHPHVAGREPARRGGRRHGQDDGAGRAARRGAAHRARDDRRARRHHVHREGGDRARRARARGARGRPRRRRRTPTSATRLDAALRGLYRARIETIHAFATSLLRERPVESPVDPGLRVLDEVAASVLFSEVYDAWLDEILQAAPGALERAVRRGFDTTHLRRLAEVLHEHRAALPCVAAHRTRPRTPPRSSTRSRPRPTQLRAELGACTNPDADAGYRAGADAHRVGGGAARAARRSGRGRAPRAVPRARRCAAGAGDKGNWASDAALAALRTAAESLDEEVGDLRRRAARRGDRRDRAARRGVRRALRGPSPRRRRRGLRRPARVGARPAAQPAGARATSTSATAAC